MSEEKKYLTQQDLADYWGVSFGSVRAALHRDSIPGAVEIAGRTVFDKEVVIDGWIPRDVKKWQREKRMPTLAVKEAKSAREVADIYFDYLAAHVPLDRWLKVINKALDQAELGDPKARSWLSNNLMGTPVQRVIAAVAVEGAIPEEKLAGVLETMLQVARKLREEKEVRDAEEDVIEGEVVNVIGPNGANADATKVCSKDS